MDTLEWMLSCLEGVIKIGAFGGSGPELLVLFRGDVVVAVGSAMAAINDGEGALVGVVSHRGDDARRHGIGSRTL